MTKANATRVLINMAAKGCASVGQGLRAIPSADDRARTIEAIKKMWPTVYPFPCGSVELRNLGL